MNNRNLRRVLRESLFEFVIGLVSCMSIMRSSPDSHRRRFLARVLLTVQSAIGGTVAFVLGGAILPPRATRRQEDWIPAGTIGELRPTEPVAKTVRFIRTDGYTEIVDRQVVFLVKTDSGQVTALSSTCTHLGCRVSWDREARVLRCPCHGGTYAATGEVIAGPPPAPLATLPIRVEGDQVLVQL